MSNKNESELLEDALALALKAHWGQKDRAGQPYVLHPIRVMCRVQTAAEKVTALLHDVVEDTDITFAELRARGFPEEVVQAVDCLTKREGEDYAQLIRRSQSNSIAARVKLADLEDNMDLRRGSDELTEQDLARFNKYRLAWAMLSKPG
jgi:(p)ppGpp synthase/HD superfamily hydrolase